MLHPNYVARLGFQHAVWAHIYWVHPRDVSCRYNIPKCYSSKLDIFLQEGGDSVTIPQLHSWPVCLRATHYESRKKRNKGAFTSSYWKKQTQSSLQCINTYFVFYPETRNAHVLSLSHQFHNIILNIIKRQKNIVVSIVVSILEKDQHQRPFPTELIVQEMSVSETRRLLFAQSWHDSKVA